MTNDMDNNRAFASHRATLASPQAPTGLGHSEGIANAGDFEAWIPFSVRMAITRAISDPGAIVGPRLSTDNCYEQMAHWQGRAALEAMLRCAVSSPQLAQAIEARRAETLGSVHESAVHAPKTPQGTDNGQ